MNKCCNSGQDRCDRNNNSFGRHGFIILVLFILLAIIASTMFTY